MHTLGIKVAMIIDAPADLKVHFIGYMCSPCGYVYQVLHGNGLCGEKEFRRALSAYKQAVQYRKSIPRQATSNARSSVFTTGWSPSTNSLNLMSYNENGLQVKFHIALPHSALHECREVLQVEGVLLK